jgi:uncharacterized membrane protein
MKFNHKVTEMWAKWFVSNALTAVVILGKSPLDFSGSDWKHAANTLWLAIVPVVIAWANPNHDLTMTKAK